LASWRPETAEGSPRARRPERARASRRTHCLCRKESGPPLERAQTGFRALAHQRHEPAGRARPREPRLAPSFWPWPRRHAVGLWGDGRTANPSRIARLARVRLCRARLAVEAIAQIDYDLDRL